MTAEIELYQQPDPPESRQRASAMPYMSFRTLKGLEETLREEGLPARFDGSYFSNSSGSTAAQTRSTLKFFGFIDEKRAPTDLLKRLITAPADEATTIMRSTFEDTYADVLALPENATFDQLAELMREKGINGATARKAVSFFISMADDLGVPYSPHFKKGRSAGSTTIRRRPAKKVVPADLKPEELRTPTPTPAPTAPSRDALRAKYVNLLMEKVEKSTEDLPADLLDRIERALGYEDDTQTSEKEVP